MNQDYFDILVDQSSKRGMTKEAEKGFLMVVLVA